MKGGIQEWKDSGLEGYLKGGIRERRNAVQVGLRTGGYNRTGMQECRKGGMQENRDAGKQGCRKVWMQESRGSGKYGCRKAGIQDMRDTNMVLERHQLKKTTILI